MTWTERDGTCTAKSGPYTLSVWQSEQYRSYSWSIVRRHMVKAGNDGTLEDAQKAAEAAVTALGQD